MIRVIAGKYRNRKLKKPPREITRPTMDKVKESIFNMIQFDISGAIVLDLFSGSGSLAIEAASRGAMKVIAVDKSKEAISVINENIQTIDIKNIEVVTSDVIAYIKNAGGKKFDFIFIDPPFLDYDIYDKTFKVILNSKILKKYGLIILETKDPKKINIPEGLVIQKQKKYGISHVLLVANNI